MTTTTAVTAIVHKRLTETSSVKRIIYGILELVLAGLILFIFALKVPAENVTKFVMTPGGITIGKAGDWIIPTQLTLYILVAVSVVLAAIQIVRGFGKGANIILGLVAVFFIFSFLTWQASGKSLNLAGMLSSAVLLSVPITLGAYSGVLCERSGVINIAIEGMMLMGSMVGALVGSLTHNALIGLLAAILAAVLLAAVHAVLSIKYKINQVISGTVINIFSTGMTSFISQKFLQTNQALNAPPMFPRIPIPGLAEIPVLGPILFNTNLFVYIMFIHPDCP